jgi:chemotaxis protein MotA
MMIIIGLIMIFGLVFGGYTLSGGSFDVILHALPYEGMMVGGASIGALVASNSFQVTKMTFSSMLRAFTGPRWKPSDYSDLLGLMYELAKAYRTNGAIGIEPHIERPDESDIFKKYPKITKHHESLDLIVDAFRMVTMQFEDPLHTDEVINKKIDSHHQHMMQPIKALNAMADALPAIGIIAAVLGVVKTMASVDKPPVILGAMIGGALVGTFLGVFLAYCFIQPLAIRVKQIETQDAGFDNVIRDVIVSVLHGYPPALCIEIGRGNIPPNCRPGFEETEAQQKTLKA